MNHQDDDQLINAITFEDGAVIPAPEKVSGRIAYVVDEGLVTINPDREPSQEKLYSDRQFAFVVYTDHLVGNGRIERRLHSAHHVNLTKH